MQRIVYYNWSIMGLVVFMVTAPWWTWGQTGLQEIQQNLQETANKVEALEEEIAKDEANLNRLAGEQQTLSSTIAGLRSSERRLAGDIAETEEEITITELEIQTLAQQIEALALSIENNEQFIGATLREIYKTGDTGLWEALLLYDTFSDFLHSANTLSQTGDLLQDQLLNLRGSKDDLLVANNQKELAKYELEEQFESLEDRKQVVAITKQTKETLLRETKNEEEVYQASLAEKQRALREFEQRIQQLELELSIAIDESQVQQKLVGLFSWPFSGWYRITQFFGNTSYAAGGAYNGRGHSGVDFGTPMGTPIVAVMDGVVTASDDTGAHGATINGVYRPCVSYGKWIVIDHENGLSTRVNHLSLIKVSDGERVRRGQIIGYSGNSGISTGPHLHLSVMATQGVQIRRLGEVMATTACRDARAPITAANAYRDPFDYLPRPEFTLQAVAFGENGRNVRNLQMMLKHERIFPIEISANGVYGPTTAAAVLEWQKKYRVDEIGVLEAGEGKTFGTGSIERYGSLF